MNDPILDKLGKEITEGCYIAYGHALGRCAGLRIGKVAKIKTEMETTMWSSTLRLVYRITVRGVDDDWSSQAPKLTQRKGTLQFPDRTIVLSPEQVPAPYRELLDS